MTEARPEHHEYFMNIAIAVRSRALCLGRSVGAVLIRDGRIISTGYNGTPENMPNCDEREHGCLRCASPEKFPAGTSYDLCICVHAEQNALLSAARFGTPIEGSVLYSTLRPCFGCTKEALQAHVQAIYYLHDWSHPDEEVRSQYERIQARFPGGVRPLTGIVDPDEADKGAPLESTGHESEGQEPAPVPLPAP
jgi:dCMP deaminase